MVTTIAKHASLLGNSICEDYITLNAIIIRHEALIRKRWLKKSTSQRRAVLLETWPDMTESHRPDCLELANNLKEALQLRDKITSPSDACTWPYVNLEDLLKPKSLLIFLNARGRNAPMSFARSEHKFNPLAECSPCRPEPEVDKYLLYLSSDPDPLQYGSTITLDKDREKYKHNEDGWYLCMRPALHILYTQERILRFLVACCRHILHDMSAEQWMSADVLDEPSKSELELRDDVGHTTFADSLAIAPYRQRGSLDLPRLRGYIESLAMDAKDHLWALREDPSYFCDTILEVGDYEPALILDDKGRTHPVIDTTHNKLHVIRDMVAEAYRSLQIWEEMLRVLKELETICCDTPKDRFASLMSEFNCRAHAACNVLTVLVCTYASSAPTMRRLYRRRNIMKNGKERPSIVSEPGGCRSMGEKKALLIFDCFFTEMNKLDDGRIYYVLDNLDMLVQKDETVQALLTPKLARLITQLSLASECAFQYSLWLNTPSALGVNMDAEHTHDHDFLGWLRTVNNCHFPVHLIDPTRGKLRYPAHKAHNRSNVMAMRTAEANLDAFWDWVDAYFEQKTGVGQHDVIRRCVLEGGQMRRTPPWDKPLQEKSIVVVEKPEYIYQPFSRIYHQREMQITGAFDRMPHEEKIKPKTKGTADQRLSTTDMDAPNEGRDVASEKRQTFSLDKRAYRVMKSLFHVATYETGEYPKAVKWDEFKRAMVRLGFSAEKLQGSAWQFSPGRTLDVERGIHFHEPHPDSDIPYTMARRFGRRLERVYGWNGNTFKLA
jgi:hypothetical protein